MRGFAGGITGALGALTLLIAGSSSAQTAPQTDALLRQGPFGSGLAILALEDTTRPTPSNGTFTGSPTRQLPTTVWYPTANRAANQAFGAPVANAPRGGFPLVVFGHGIALSASEGSFVASHLATNGYVVIGPDFPLSKGTAPGGPTATDIPGQARDVLFLIEQFRNPLFQAFFQPAARIDFSRIGVLGYSLGGATVALAGSDPSIDAVATLAPAICPLVQTGGRTNLNKPLFILQGTTDLVVPPRLNSQVLFDSSGDPRRLVTLDNGSHGGFFTNGTLVEGLLSILPGIGVDTGLCLVLGPTLGADPTANACGLCNPPITGTQVPVARQQNLARAGVLAFFNAYLRCSRPALQYLDNAYDGENPELTSRISGRPGQGLETCPRR